MNTRLPLLDDARDQLWQSAFETYYDCFFEEILSNRVINRWQLVDDTAKVLVAVTALGSAVSGWALWSLPGFRQVWAVIAGISALLAIVHASLGVSARLKDWSEIKRLYSILRIDIQSFKYRMSTKPDVDINRYQKEFFSYRKRYAEAVSRERIDILATDRLKIRCQEELNHRIADEIEEGACDEQSASESPEPEAQAQTKAQASGPRGQTEGRQAAE